MVTSGADMRGRVEGYTLLNESRIKVMQMMCSVLAGSVSHYVRKQVKKVEILGCTVCGIDGHTVMWQTPWDSSFRLFGQSTCLFERKSMELFVLLRIVGGVLPKFTCFAPFASFRLVSNALSCDCADVFVRCLFWEIYLQPVVHSDWISCGSGIVYSLKSLGTLGIMNCFARLSPLRVESNACSWACVVFFVAGSEKNVGLLSSMLALRMVNLFCSIILL